MMKRKPEQIIVYAARLVASKRNPKPLLAVLGGSVVVLVILTLKKLFDKQSQLGESLVTNEHFLLGFVFAVFCFLGVGFGVTILVISICKIRGVESDACELLLELWKERNGGQSSRGDSEKAADGLP